MSKGKYSPTVYAHKHQGDYAQYKYNAKGEMPVQFERDRYNEETMFVNYNSEGFDSYGYSAYSRDGTFVGAGNGVDRNGYTENDYQNMSDEAFDEWDSIYEKSTLYQRY